MNYPRIARWLRYIAGGGINTIFTYGIYLLFKDLIGYQLAYFLAYFTGILLSYWLNAVFVFKVSLSWKALFSYPLVYVVQYVVSAMFLGVIVEIMNVSEYLAPLMVVIIMIPITYFLTKYFLNAN